jgi:hypothetical protein
MIAMRFSYLQVLEIIEWEVSHHDVCQVPMSKRNIDKLLAILKQAGNSMNDQYTQLKSINASGYPLQIAIANAVKASSGSHGWRVLYEEHAWRRDDREGFIDLVLEHENLQVVLLIECKRLSDTKWEFLHPEGHAHARRIARARLVIRDEGSVRANYPIWADAPADPPTPVASFCVMPKERGGFTVDAIAAELVAATEALEREECGYLDRRGGDSRRLYFAAIVTTAPLSVCTFDPNTISLADGRIAEGAKFVPVDALRYTKQLSTRPIGGVPVGLFGQEGDVLVRAKERTVFVIRAEGLDDFLHDFNVDDRDKNG